MEPDPDVLEMVRRQLDRDPQPSTEALYGRAARINSDIYGLSLRQFNATYVLRVKRERKRQEGGGAGRTGTGGSGSPGGGSESGEGEPSGAEGDEVEPRPGGFLDSLREARSGDGDAPDAGAEGSDGSGDGPPAAEASATEDRAPSGSGPGLRERVRGVLLRYARQVVGTAGTAGAVAAVQAVDERVEDIVELAGAPAGEGSAD